MPSSEIRRTRIPAVRIIAGVLLAAVGAVWFAQGIGVLKGSVMTGEAFWAVVGAPMFVIGVFLVVSSGRRARSAPDEPAASSSP